MHGTPHYSTTPNIPEPIAGILRGFKQFAHQPALFAAHVEALFETVFEVAGGDSPFCISCGASPNQEPTREPKVVELPKLSPINRMAEAFQYTLRCGICGATYEPPPDEGPVDPRDWDAIAKDELIESRR
ncbi:MAG TPA: hypothetical protein VN612_04615 [Acidobacteriaceae bacterium]|nr:hypothetical protein [Acidobacteriaceae bacterium]